jgi:KipI family sensor histidine kinase inhibitor
VSRPRATLTAYGDIAFLVELDLDTGVDNDTDRVLDLADAIRDARLVGVVDVVPGATSVLVRCDAPEVVAAARDRVAGLEPPVTTRGHDSVVTIDVTYDGADLDAVAEATGLGAGDVVAAHAAATYRAAFVGFRPGFAYLTGLDSRLRLPRRASPRTAVPAGSVAIADRYTGIYPAESPGGWHLLGHTDAALWDVARTPPALLVPGTVVRFVPR